MKQIQNILKNHCAPIFILVWSLTCIYKILTTNVFYATLGFFSRCLCSYTLVTPQWPQQSRLLTWLMKTASQVCSSTHRWNYKVTLMLSTRFIFVCIKYSYNSHDNYELFTLCFICFFCLNFYQIYIFFKKVSLYTAYCYKRK